MNTTINQKGVLTIWRLAVVQFLRRTIMHCPLLVVVILSTRNSIGMDFVKISADGKGFVLVASEDRFVPWGHNYSSVDIMQRLAQDSERVEREFVEMKAAGTTVALVHPEMPGLL